MSGFAAEKTGKDFRCKDEEHWVRAHFRGAYIRGDGTPVAASNVTAHCQGNPPSYAVWKSKTLEGRPRGWQYPNEKNSSWQPDEKERLFEALESVPKALWLKTIKGIYRLRASSQFDKNPASGNDGNIVLYDRAFGREVNLSRVLSHEFSHEEFRQLSGADKISYSNAAEWKVVRNGRGTPVLIPMRENYLEEDGKESVDEDFSNNIEYFLFEPQKLKSTSPNVYAWIQNHYGDKFRVASGGSK